MSYDAPSMLDRQRELPRGVLIILAIVFIAIVLAAFCSYGIKAYVLANSSIAAFEGCGVAFALEMFFFSVVAFSMLTACGIGFALFTCYKGADEAPTGTNQNYLRKGALLVCGLAVISYGFVAVGSNAVAWFTTNKPEEAFLFFAEFYEDDFSNCTSGKDLEVVELAIGLYKVESFIVMVLILLACPCLLFYALCFQELPAE